MKVHPKKAVGEYNFIHRTTVRRIEALNISLQVSRLPLTV
jgi:hypothetical protein